MTYRLSLGLAALVWICIASTFCGCNQTTAFVNNQAGRSHYEHGNYTAARHAFERAHIDNPQNPDYAFNVAAARRKQGDALGAEQMYRRTLTLDPSHQPAYHGMAGLLREQGRQADAQQLLTAWSETQPYDAESHVELAWLQRQEGNLPAAEQSLRQALQISPRHPTALAHLGQVYQQTGRPREAAGMYRRSLQVNPYQPQVKTQLAQLSSPNAGGMRMAAMSPPNGSYASGATPVTTYMMPGGNPNFSGSMTPMPDSQMMGGYVVSQPGMPGMNGMQGMPGMQGMNGTTWSHGPVMTSWNNGPVMNGSGPMTTGLSPVESSPPLAAPGASPSMIQQAEFVPVSQHNPTQASWPMTDATPSTVQPF